MKWGILVLVLLISLLVTLYFNRQGPNKIIFCVYYGANLATDQIRDYQLLVLEPDAISIKAMDWPADKTYLGYLSVGEIHQSRPYWWRVVGRPYLLERNPDWAGAYRIDVRSEEWQVLLLDEIIPSILGRGYHGLFLDTVDTARYLEGRDSGGFKGSQQSLIQLIKHIRARFPSIKIMINNGLELLPELGGVIDGVFVEALYTHYNFQTRVAGPTPEAVYLAKEALLTAFKTGYSKPIFNLIYDSDEDSELVRWARQRSEQLGFHWYLSRVELNQLGMHP